eukprot:m.139259 g.139259  ORF g.139259 m.139259 type:complete len:1142 (-) comp30045_c0_seq6:246-3671(-)
MAKSNDIHSCMLISTLILQVAARTHPAEQHVGTWDTPPYSCPTTLVSDCPLLGNGDLGAGLGGIASSPDGGSMTQTFYLGKMDFWTQQNNQKAHANYAHVAPAHVTMNFGSNLVQPIPAQCDPIPKGPGGYCNRPQTIPCGQQRGHGCVIDRGPYNETAVGRMAVQTMCDQSDACLAYGLDVKSLLYELYTNAAEILQPLATSKWSLYYKNDTCCFSSTNPTPAISLDFKATQELYAARVNTTLNTTSSKCGIVSSTSVVAPDANVLVSRFSVTKPCNLSLTLQSPNMYGLPITVGVSNNALWMGRWNNKWVNNDAVVSECAPLVANSAALRYFKINTTTGTTATSGRIGSLYNESAAPSDAMCMWLATDAAETQPHQSRGSFVSTAPCGTHGTNWYFNAVTATISSLDNASVCVGYHVGAAFPMPSSRQVVTAVDCESFDSTMWAVAFNVTNTHVHDGYGMFMAALAGVASTLDPRAIDPTPPCLSIVRKNINISLGMAVSLATSQGFVAANDVRTQNMTSPSCLFPSGVSGWCPDIYSSSASFELIAGTEYTLQAAIVSTRDGVEPEAISPIAKAITLATMSDASVVELANAESWTTWWEASSVSLGPQRQILEGFWYGAQYMLNCFTKNETGGGVIPGLLGPWSMQDPVGWSDDVTLDYNAEANFYGAASSNHPQAMSPYFPTLTALIPLGQQRASLESWNQGGHESDGFFGQQTEAMGCNCNDYNHCYEPACPSDFGGFDGIEIPSAIGGFVEMHCSHDSAMRSTAAMAAQPFVDFYEHTMDQNFLKTTAYPYIKEVAKFYASYVVLDPHTKQYHVPLACAQEVCSGRQQGGYHPQESPTIDLAYAKYIFVRAIKWGRSLGEDDKVLQQWTFVSANLKPYPTTTMPPSEFPWCASSNCTGWSEATNTNTNTSAVMPANYMWPIANFAPIHPTGLVSLSDDAATKTLARNTVWIVNSYSKWHPVNGICLAWPSAARMMDRNDPYPFGPTQLLENWENALNKTMQRNFWPSMGGGGIEQVGATQAVNELLLQSFEGFLRIFPGWPLNESASFTTLRAVGAFLVSAAVSNDGVVGTVTVLSEMGLPLMVLSPWSRGITVIAKGVPIATKDLGDNMYMFETDTQTTYTISPVAVLKNNQEG